MPAKDKWKKCAIEAERHLSSLAEDVRREIKMMRKVNGTSLLMAALEVLRRHNLLGEFSREFANLNDGAGENPAEKSEDRLNS